MVRRSGVGSEAAAGSTTDGGALVDDRCGAVRRSPVATADRFVEAAEERSLASLADLGDGQIK
ncbi:putative pollen-specific leucine-rich repeat extensin-like protein 3 [Iris pallida]|uniref:Pollen-specific leucine-rich repeat extensin-like protein 3 n=1 Tax=Iris pallida TaxID=29817 RepID=A0AAX6HSI3_IRIPA|nr:putative pollen-specific leucine-rich repeat extensin-like protein 3 [Iris pallida]KAJ6843663.1 putative pollen-specific leucine-rich repeat extensin-like protein 3 [Iris pallida]